MLRLYTLKELVDAGKVLIRGITGVGTEAGTDHDLTLNAAARMLQGAQIAGKYIFDQLEPKTADATNRDRMIDFHGLTFEREATKAVGLVALRYATSVVGTVLVDAGTEFSLPGSAFPDGIARTFKILESARITSVAYDDSDFECDMRTGSSIWKARPKHIAGAGFLKKRSLLRVLADNGSSKWLTAARRVNIEDQSVDFLIPVKGALADPADVDEKVGLVNDDVVLMAECTTAGAAGNCPWTIANVDVGGVADGYIVIFEMAGGGDAVGEIDGNQERVTRLLEDTIACPPSFGNVQHWRELALKCPDVDLDDAVVYQHVRGPGTIDIVGIGRSGGSRSASFPDAHIEFTFWGNNTRRIGEVAAERLEAWCKSHAPYFADVKCRSVEWDWRGNYGAISEASAFFFGASVIDLRIDYHDGYGPDSGVELDIVPHTRTSSTLYPATTPGGTVPEQLKVGDRVWVVVSHQTAALKQPFATLVTEIIGIASDRSYATIANVANVVGDTVAVPDMEDSFALVIHRWGTAGPLTQPILDAVYAYYDKLGPGSYPLPPKGPGYMRAFAVGVHPPAPGHIDVERWPPEGRRWNSSLRASTLRAAIEAVPGVRSVLIGAEQDLIVDMDPKVFETLALTGCIPRYGLP